MANRIFTSKDKEKVLARAIFNKQAKISLWKDSNGVWHAALGPENTPKDAIEVDHIR